ncbi:hypothetical protein COU17_02345 [Candidatus Kaiserbacteria bacterium CG10_big_fil_rev_8_21_14_0_10_49_17]|uniref:Uncharacterized protein n=1 Tax=Candidatus Kaiserbacteria bacterium CG10_big_fil_rev_8_21_14_0_10_49_17 TaxID=1974609 RepID=A0A2M6WE88_9BACT|nr:MAG: hypothetical protein COU17_02345 [Candidatus Kaiserbacteria bacterium CG10_big_fil_rev_8_21_14_0_10_49_17]
MKVKAFQATSMECTVVLYGHELTYRRIPERGIMLSCAVRNPDEAELTQRQIDDAKQLATAVMDDSELRHALRQKAEKDRPVSSQEAAKFFAQIKLGLREPAGTA